MKLYFLRKLIQDLTALTLVGGILLGLVYQQYILLQCDRPHI